MPGYTPRHPPPLSLKISATDRNNNTDDYQEGELTVTHRLEFREVFDSLSITSDEVKDKDSQQAYNNLKVYAHHLARACWYGGRIMLRQTSPEAEGIFELILELHKACNGRWSDFHKRGVNQDDIDVWLDYAGLFLSSLGNHFVCITIII